MVRSWPANPSKGRLQNPDLILHPAMCPCGRCLSAGDRCWGRAGTPRRSLPWTRSDGSSHKHKQSVTDSSPPQLEEPSRTGPTTGSPFPSSVKNQSYWGGGGERTMMVTVVVGTLTQQQLWTCGSHSGSASPRSCTGPACGSPCGSCCRPWCAPA